MLTFLKQLGLDIAKGIAIISGIADFLPTKAQPVAATVTSDANQLLTYVAQVEAIGAAMTPGMTGAQKLTAATPLVAQFFLSMETLVGKTQQDPTLFTTGAQQVASGIANILNSYKAQPASGTPALTGAPAAAAPIPPTPGV